MSRSSTQSTAAKVAVLLLLATAAVVGIAIYANSQGPAIEGAPSKRKGKKGSDEEEAAEEAGGAAGGAKAASVPKPASQEQKQKDEVQAKFEELNKKAVEAFKSGDLEGAVKIFTEALELGQSHQSLANQIRIVLYNRSSCYEKLNRIDEALDDCAKVLLRDQTNEKAKKRREKLLQGMIEKEDWEAALTELMVTFLLQLESYKLQALMGMMQQAPDLQPPEGIDMVAKKATQAVIDQLEAAGRTGPRTLPSSYTIRQVLSSLPSYGALKKTLSTQRAVQDISDEIDKAAKLEDKTPLLFERALAQIAENRFKRADEDLDEAAKAVLDGHYSGPQQADILSWAGTFAHLRNDLTKAKLLLDRAGELQPDNAETWVKRGCLCLDKSEHEDAKAMLDRAKELEPEAAYLYVWRCQMHMSGKEVTEQKLKEAEAELRKCLELDPENTMALTRLTNMRMQQNDMEGAEETILKAKRAEPRNSDVVCAHAEFLLMKNQPDEASREFDKSIRLDSNNPVPFLNKGLIAWQSGNMTEAKTHLLHTLSLDPLYQPAYAFLANLELKNASNVEETMAALDFIEKGISVCRSKDDLEEMVQIKVLTLAKVAAMKRLGLSGRINMP